MEAFSVEADVPGGLGAARRARCLVERALAGRLPDPAVDDVRLLVTELVANGVRHGGAVEGIPLHLRVEARPPALRVEVENPADGTPDVAPRPPDSGRGGGLGLYIIERVASRWGIRDGQRTAVWCELDLV
jgi:anti-sigma regulatory factor (Ser/Thr protein kinase)